MTGMIGGEGGASSVTPCEELSLAGMGACDRSSSQVLL